MQHEQAIRSFFADYESRFNKALESPPVTDVEGTAGAFATCFVEASPLGINCGSNDESFRKAIPEGNAFYRNIGTVSMRVARLDITELDEYHALAKVHWDSRYLKEGKEITIEFDVIYLLQVLSDMPKIFAYITGDEQKVLKEHGLV